MLLFDDYSGLIFYDGAIGTMLEKRGLVSGERPDILNITAPDDVENVHRMYVNAGSDIIVTNTFGANAAALRKTGYSPEAIIAASVAIAKRAAGAAAKVALDIGPLGSLIEPLGDVEFERAYELFKEQAIAGETAGADFAAIETMSDLTELEAAMRAVSENTRLPILATMTFDRGGYTFTGCSPESFAKTAEHLGAVAVGLNCSLAPSEMYEVAERIAKTTNLPLIVKPNAGLPDSRTGLYSIGPVEFAQQMAPFVEIGARIVGGCCGTTPEYIQELRKKLCGS
ncbi:MAG: homocysteine S-methyltransferase family protein [Oscillospiraceae bacterium]|jgi:5-methyltetrahydrofolate--homocysteine methyltransferase|nr:homocysteine S-methyltransferase family protein [Oscillospiraceae bacterium]